MPAGYLLDPARAQTSKAPAPLPIVTEPRKRKATFTADHIPALVAILRDMKTHPKAKFCAKLGVIWTEVEEKLENREYQSSYEFALDVRKMWTAAFKRFSAGSQEYIAAVELSDYFEKALSRKGDEEGKKAPCLAEERKVRPLTLHEKTLLAMNIRMLDKHYLRRIVDIVSGSKAQQTYTEEFEFDIDKLTPEIARELDTYVQQCIGKQSPVQPPKTDLPRPETSSSSSSSDSEEDNGNPLSCSAAIH